MHIASFPGHLAVPVFQHEIVKNWEWPGKEAIICKCFFVHHLITKLFVELWLKKNTDRFVCPNFVLQDKTLSEREYLGSILSHFECLS